jgi:LysR family hydrogen peroxide-inducible transcriptional activator
MAIVESAPHPFSLRQLQYVVAVADALSFRRAAASCHVSQPSLSAQVAALESSIGAKLFERDRRRVVPTALGREFVERARLLLRQVDDLLVTARRFRDPLEGTLRIGVIPTISPYLLPRLTPAIRAAHPGLTIQWAENKTRVLVRELAGGQIDAALLALEAEIGDVERAVVARDAFVLVAPKGDPLARKTAPVRASELRGASVLVLEDEHCFGQQALAFCSSARARDLEFRATSLSTVAQMVAAGAGVTLLPELAVPTEARLPSLRVRRFVRPAPSRTIALVWRRGSPLADGLTRLAATMREAYPLPPSPAARSRAGVTRRPSPARRPR